MILHILFVENSLPETTAITTTIIRDPAAYWISDASLTYKRANHEAVLLANGKVMVAGGQSCLATIVRISEFYSSPLGWQSGPPTRNSRLRHTLTAFDGNTKALAAGSIERGSRSTAEVYDSITNTWTPTSTNMLTGRFAHAATLIYNEQILIIGGIDSSRQITSTTELYLPSSDSFIAAAALNVGRVLFATTVLNDGSTVLVTGGGDENLLMTPTAELYVSGSWQLLNNMMTQPRAYHAAVLLPDGNVLIAGGGNGAFMSFSTAEIFDTTQGTFKRVGSMKYRRAMFTLTLLPSGKVLATGGIDWNTNTYPDTCELYDPITQTWSITKKLYMGRRSHRSILLNDFVLTIGGYDSFDNQTASCEKYRL